MIAIGVVLATFIGLAIITAFIEAETVGYADWLPGWLLHRAAKKLPDGERDRWLEEWLADLNQLPKAPITRLGWALMQLEEFCAGSRHQAYAAAARPAADVANLGEAVGVQCSGSDGGGGGAVGVGDNGA